jgi:K+-sensing histidine kinase KdpD
LENAINHIQLILKDKSGEIKTVLKAQNAFINGNKSHFTNIIINLLDNAVKYCNKRPKLELETYNDEGDFVIKVKDNGIGMTPAVQKRYSTNFTERPLEIYTTSKGTVWDLPMSRKLWIYTKVRSTWIARMILGLLLLYVSQMNN